MQTLHPNQAASTLVFRRGRIYACRVEKGLGYEQGTLDPRAMQVLWLLRLDPLLLFHLKEVGEESPSSSLHPHYPPTPHPVSEFPSGPSSIVAHFSEHQESVELQAELSFWGAASFSPLYWKAVTYGKS